MGLINPKTELDSATTEATKGKLASIADAFKALSRTLTTIVDFINKLNGFELDYGYLQVNAADAGGTLVYLNKEFGAILCTIVSVRTSAAAKMATHTMGPFNNPQTFRILSWDAAGARATDQVFWLVLGTKRVPGTF